MKSIVAGILLAAWAASASAAVTLGAAGAAPQATAADRAALDALERQLAGGQADAAAYVRLAGLQRRCGHELQAIFSALRGFTLDTTSREAAREAETAFFAGVAAPGEDGNIQITLGDEGLRDDPLAPLALGRALAAATRWTGGEDEDASAVERWVGAFQSFLAIAAERGADREELEGTPTWRLSAGPVVALHRQELSEPLLYLLAERAGIAGAAGWIGEHPREVGRLRQALAAARK